MQSGRRVHSGGRVWLGEGRRKIAQYDSKSNTIIEHIGGTELSAGSRVQLEEAQCHQEAGL